MSPASSGPDSAVVPCSLAAARCEGTYEVVGIDGDDGLARRLLDLGLWPGTVVQMLTAAPFGDPMLFWLHGFRLALRRDEARRVRVRPATGGAS
ncbi:MAG: ferrous iron transport protein A [Planctomycetes bacterium]|nr:ferrous iron transport protein A [Planctomycetota bacterium]